MDAHPPPGHPEGHEHDAAARPLFSATIRPHRSMGVRGVKLVLVLVGLASLVASIPFIVMGFWPVAGFYGLDVLLLFFALRGNLDQARSYEEIVVSPVELLVRKVPVRGAAAEWRFNPLWTRLRRDIHAEFGVQRLSLVSRGLAVPVGHFLSPDEKERFGDRLSVALSDARRGPVYDHS
ncbi:DUF2244 domain-containing protein [Alsobacter sp. SYSU M60028]|uniref:DUF2244 domain-containing protein n=1 Tax=Alsobacter ponti TaxID=2962936 RepID=A0ABT1LCU1_9HYPH|nr:DUF2244 domain-containing protein [Alsobacter ponti]MCP8938073.1 DUF2244 domain-containing protein [Alsobacter ponti]